MAFKYADRVKETTSNKPVGGGTPAAFNLGGAKTGFQTFIAGVATTNTCVACAQQVDANGNPSGAWEIFTGTVTAGAPDTLSRTTLISSATGAWIDWSATGVNASPDVFVTAPAQHVGFRGAGVKLTVDEFPPSSVTTVIPWDASFYDTDGFWAVTPNPSRLTIPTGAGIHRIRLTANCGWNGVSGGLRLIQLYKNGAGVDGAARDRDPAALGFVEQSISSAILDAIDGDYFEMAVHQSGGSSVSIVASVDSNFSIEVIE